MANEGRSMRQQLDDSVVDLRNEVIVQAAGAFEFGHRLVLASVGAVLLGLDQVHALVQTAAERGEQAEADMQQMAGDLRERMVNVGETARTGVATRTTAAVSSGVASLLNHLPAVSVTYKAPSPAGQVEVPGQAVSVPDAPATANGEMA